MIAACGLAVCDESASGLNGSAAMTTPKASPLKGRQSLSLVAHALVFGTAALLARAGGTRAAGRLLSCARSAGTAARSAAGAHAAQLTLGISGHSFLLCVAARLSLVGGTGALVHAALRILLAVLLAALPIPGLGVLALMVLLALALLALLTLLVLLALLALVLVLVLVRHVIAPVRRCALAWMATRPAA